MGGRLTDKLLPFASVGSRAMWRKVACFQAHNIYMATNAYQTNATVKAYNATPRSKLLSFVVLILA